MPKAFLAVLLFIALLLVQGGPADAASAKKKDDHGAASKDGGHGPKEKEDKGLFGSEDNIVRLPTIIVPVSKGGRVDEYLYMYLIAVTDGAEKASKVKEKLPYVLDALVRESHRAKLSKAADGGDADVKPLLDAMVARINELVGEPFVTQIAVDRIDHAPF